MPSAVVHRLSASAPDDLSAFERAIIAGRIDPASLVAVIGKTEGNGCVNDFSRGFATMAWQQRLKAIAPNLSLVMSGGCEGAIAPHWITFETRNDESTMDGPSLAIGVGHTRDLAAHEIGTQTQIDLVSEKVEALIKENRIDNVHLVQIKCPLLSAERIRQAKASGFDVATTDTLKSMGLSRGAAAQGVAKALGEGDWSSVASSSAGIELMCNEIVVLGMSQAWSGDLMIDHAVMQDALDIEPVRQALERLGLQASGQLSDTQRSRVVALLAKAEAAPDGMIRGYRHTMLDDSDVSSTRHARALVGGALGGLIGHGELYVSGGAERQGPPGGGPVAIIARKGK